MTGGVVRAVGVGARMGGLLGVGVRTGGLVGVGVKTSGSVGVGARMGSSTVAAKRWNSSRKLNIATMRKNHAPPGYHQSVSE